METEYKQAEKPWNERINSITLGNKLVVNVGMEDQETFLLPSNFLTKVRIGLSVGYIMMRRFRIRIVPLVSRNAGVSGKLYIRDTTDLTGRKLHSSEQLLLGREIRLELPHLDFSVPTSSDVPIAFGFSDLVSPFLEARELFSICVKWDFALSSTCYSMPATTLRVVYLEDALAAGLLLEQKKKLAEKKTSGRTRVPVKMKARKTDSSV